MASVGALVVRVLQELDCLGVAWVAGVGLLVAVVQATPVLLGLHLLVVVAVVVVVERRTVRLEQTVLLLSAAA